MLGKEIASVAALDEPVRRALYEHIVRHGEVSRDQASRALGISRMLAAFHLDKLVNVGLLETSFRRVSGRQGPGAGRPSKFYRRSKRDVELSLPSRRYKLIAQLFADSLEDPRAVPARDALYEAARNVGRETGREVRRRAGTRASDKRMLDLAQAQLEADGYEPQKDGLNIRLRNCPFDQLAHGHRSLVCGANQCLLQGFVGGLEVKGIQARLEPDAGGHCCVILQLPRSASQPAA